MINLHSVCITFFWKNLLFPSLPKIESYEFSLLCTNIAREWICFSNAMLHAVEIMSECNQQLMTGACRSAQSSLGDRIESSSICTAVDSNFWDLRALTWKSWNQQRHHALGHLCDSHSLRSPCFLRAKFAGRRCEVSHCYRELLRPVTWRKMPNFYTDVTHHFSPLSITCRARILPKSLCFYCSSARLSPLTTKHGCKDPVEARRCLFDDSGAHLGKYKARDNQPELKSGFAPTKSAAGGKLGWAWGGEWEKKQRTTPVSGGVHWFGMPIGITQSVTAAADKGGEVWRWQSEVHARQWGDDVTRCDVRWHLECRNARCLSTTQPQIWPYSR